jgi:hypothetical protein
VRQAMDQADCTASWASCRSPTITDATRIMSPWWASTIRANATSSPASARRTVAAIQEVGAGGVASEARLVMSQRCRPRGG